MLTVKSCITNTVHVHQRDSDYQMQLKRYKYVQTHIYIHIYKYIQAWIVSRLNINSSVEQFKITKVKLAFTDCTHLDQMCMLRSFLFEWRGCEVAANGNVSKKTTVAPSVHASLAHWMKASQYPNWVSMLILLVILICVRYRTFTKCYTA